MGDIYSDKIFFPQKVLLNLQFSNFDTSAQSFINYASHLNQNLFIKHGLIHKDIRLGKFTIGGPKICYQAKVRPCRERYDR